MALFQTRRRSNVACATGPIQVAISVTSIARAPTKTESEATVKRKVPARHLSRGPGAFLRSMRFRPSCRWIGAAGWPSCSLTTMSRP
jgi:hypothetical protein